MRMIRNQNTIVNMAAFVLAMGVALLVSQAASAATPAWISQPTWAAPDVGTFAKPAIADLDGDGLPDLMIGAANGQVYAYKNTGTTTVPAWTAEPSWSISTPCTVSTSGASVPQGFSAPALADLNGDGLKDLLVGMRDGVCVFQNTGSSSAPVWTRNTGWDLTGLTTVGYYAPALADLDGDGNVDLMVGRRTGVVNAYRNTTTNTASGPVWTANPVWDLYRISTYASPALADIDGDGKVDLLTGDVYGTVFTFKNTGTTSAPVWSSAGGWYIADPNTATSNYASPGIGDLDGDNKPDVLYGDASGVTSAYQQNPAGLPDPGFASSAPGGVGTTVSETFESFACTSTWQVAAGGPNTSYTRNCGNGWTAFAEDTNNAALGAVFPGPVGDQNVVTLDNTVNGPSAAPSTPLGAAEMYTAPTDSVRGVLWLLKTFPVTPGVPIQSVIADFRVKVASASPAAQYYGVDVFDGAVSNPSGTTISGVPTRPDLLAADVRFEQCGNNIWCTWHTATLGGGQTLVPSQSVITVAFMVQDTNLNQTVYAEYDNLTVSGIASVAPTDVPTNDIAQLWKQDYSDPTNNPQVGVDNWSESKDIKVDSAGNVYVAGDTYNGSNYDISLFKYDTAGNQVWHQTYGGGDSDQAVALALDASGNIYVAGRSHNTTSNDDYIVIKYNSSGVQQWATPYDNGNRIDDPTGMVVDAGGNAYVTGSSCSDAVACKYATVKFNSAGVQQWQAIYDNGGASLANNAVGIGLDGSGNIYVSGTVSGGSDNIATVKYDSAGNQLRVNVYDSGTNDRAVAMKTDSAGNVYIAGITYSAGSPAILVLKYAFDVLGGGAPVWGQTYNSIPEALPTAMAVDASGNVYITGVVGSSTDHDFITIRLMSSGAVAWAQVFGNAGVDDRATGIAVDSGGNVYVVGSMGRSTGNSDFVLVRYDTSGIARNAITYDGYSLSDTPAALVLGVDAQGDTVPYVTGVSADPDHIDHMTTVRYTKAQPDLIVTNVSGPASAVVGTSINVANTVSNVNDLANKKYADSGSFSVGIYIAPSVGGLPDMNHLTLLGSRSVANLAPGESSADTTAVTIPTSLAEGTYVLVVIADNGGVVAEADEGNNVGNSGSTISIQGILPDLAVSSVSGPSTATHGTPFNVTTTIANLVSTAASSSFRVGIYASTDSTVTTGDTLIGSYTVASLAGFATSTTTTSVTIPTAGNYYIGAIVDDQNAITEANESNNTTLMVSGSASSTLLATRADFVAGLPGTNVAVASTLNAANVRLAQTVAWTANSAWDVPDIGANAKPTLGDLNGDGVPDLLVGATDGQIYAFQNTGTASSPVWTPASAWNISTPCSITGGTNPQTYSVPRLADLNGDGLLDLVVGHRDGVCIYQNAGTNTAPAWARNTTWETSFSGLTTSRFYAPAVADLNNDGKQDIMLGNSTTTMTAYQNTGSVGSPAWTAFSGWNLTGLASAQRYSPALADLDGDGDYDLLVGNSDGLIAAYRNDGGIAAPTWVANSAWNLADPNGNINFASVAVGDLNGDGSRDLLYGDSSGVVFAYKNVGVFSSSGNYISKVVDAGTHGGFTTLAYTAVVPTGTTLTVDIRAGDNATVDGTWTGWLTSVPNGGDISALGTHRYAQYRFNFTTGDTSISSALFNIQANTAASAPVPIVVAALTGEGSGGGELSLMELMLLNLFVLIGMGRRRVIYPL